MRRPTKARTLMYTQQLEFLGGSTVEEKLDILTARVKSLVNSNDDEIAIAVHDKDVGTAPHVHVAMHFSSPRSIRGIANQFDDRKEQLTAFTGWHAPDNLFSYLFHCTTGALLKHKYDMKCIIYANFDIQARVKLISQQVKAHSTTIQLLIADFASGKISFENLIGQIGPMASWENRRQIRHINRDLKRVKHKQYLQDMENRNITEIKTLILAGGAELKKKRELAELEMQAHAITSVDVLTPDGGFFSNYHGARGIIVELPSTTYLSGRVATQWINLLSDLTQLDRVCTFGNHETAPLNLEYIIFTVDTLGATYSTGYCSYEPIATLDDYDIPKVETDDDYIDFENELKKASHQPQP